MSEPTYRPSHLLQYSYFPILNQDLKPRSPFKFNAHWLLNEDFVSLLKDSWTVYVDNPLVTPALHFAANLKHNKEVSISWSIKRKAQEFKDLVEV